MGRITTPGRERESRDAFVDGPIRLVLNYYAGLSTILVIVGVFGLMSHSVARRTREIGIRMAIGAQPREVLTAVIREAIVMVIPGVLTGLACTLALGRLIASQVDGLEPLDTTVAVTSIVLMFVIASLSGYVPARRASRVDPVIALREM